MVVEGLGLVDTSVITSGHRVIRITTLTAVISPSKVRSAISVLQIGRYCTVSAFRNGNLTAHVDGIENVALLKVDLGGFRTINFITSPALFPDEVQHHSH